MFFVSIFHSRTKSKSWKIVDRSITSLPNDAGNLCPFQSQIFHTAQIRRRKIGSLLFVKEKKKKWTIDLNFWRQRRNLNPELLLVLYCSWGWRKDSKCWSLLWEKSPQKYWHLHKPSLQHFLKMMSKIRENDGYWCFAKMLNFGSKTFKMLEFTLRIDLLFSDSQHFVF